MKRLFLLDAYALIYRAYYGFISKPLVNSKGVNTSAIYGFTKTLQDVLQGQRANSLGITLPEGVADADGLLRPDCIAVCFDPKGGTFRHKEFPSYKAQRDAQPEDITLAIPYIKQIIEAYRIPVFEIENYEADDVVGTLARLADEDGGYETFMMSPDKDYAQLVTPHSRIFKPKSFGPGYEMLDVERVLEKYGLKTTEQVIDMLGLQGDAADNIPGCPGVGPKTAQKLIEDFGSCEEMLRQVEEAAAAGAKELACLKKTMFAKVLDNAQQIRDSKYLATICRQVPGVELDAEALKVCEPDNERLYRLFDELEFRSMRDQLARKEEAAGIGKRESAATVAATDPVGAATPEDKSVQTLSTLSDVKTQYVIADTPAKRRAMLEELMPQHTELADLFSLPASDGGEGSFAFDTETTSLDVMEAELVGISLAVADHKAWYIPIPADRTEAGKIVGELRPLFASESMLKIAQNAKYDYSILKRYGLEVTAPMFDTMVAHYLLEPEQPHNMDYLSEVYLKYQPIPTSALIDTGKKKKGDEPPADLFAMFDAADEESPRTQPQTMRDVAIDRVAEYCCEDSDVTFQLAQIFIPMLREQGLTKLFEEVEMPLVKVLAEMEMTGVRLDVAALKESEELLNGELKRLELALAEAAGHPFNPLSPKAVATVLYDELHLDPKSKQRSTAEEILQQLKLKVSDEKHVQLIEDILSYRGIKKLLSTYIEALPQEVNAHTGRIHAQFNQTVTSTGRLSSSNPNLQNIPIRDALGRELRKAFIPDEGEVFFSADYSQIELRLMAHLSQDPNMVEAFLEGEDIHAATAAKIYHLPVAEVSKLQRTKAKTANFGIIYGISTFGLASRLNIPRSEAKELIDGYFATYPKIKEYMDKSIEVAREKGYVETLFGRKRMLPDIHSANATVRGYAERNAINAPIQGTAADIIKIAMVRIAQRIRREGLHAKLLIQVHDELNFSVPANELEPLQTLVLEEMAAAVKLTVPLIADCGSGANWLVAH